MSNSAPIPVVVFAFNRLQQLRKTISCLKANKVPLLIFYIDGPRNEEDRAKIDEVERFIRAISWTNVKIVKRSKNLGLSSSIQKGLNEVFTNHESAIVIEDDIEVASGFYDYMCRALRTYADRSDITGVTGLRYPFKKKSLRYTKADVFLAPRFSSWGWGTWRRVWTELDFNKESLVDKVYRHKPDLKRGGRDVEHAYYEYAANRLEGCWDVEYYANMALKGQYFVWPKYNLVQNTGLTDGTHAEGATAWKLSWEGAGSDIEDLPKDLQANSLLVKGFISYFRSVRLPVKPRLKRKLKGMVKSATTKALPSVNPDPKHYTTTDGPQEVLSQKECYYYALNNYVNDGDRVLDVGMGIGYGMGVLSIKAREVYAVDVDKKAVEYNKRRLLGRNPRVKDLILYDGKKLPFGDNFFDVVTCIDVIEHVEDYDSFLDELLRVSRRAVVIATPNRRPEYTEPDGRPKNYWHLREWSQREFDEIAQKHSQAKVKWMFVDGPWDGPHKITNKVSSDTLVLLPIFTKKK